MASLISRVVNVIISYVFAAEKRKSLEQELVNIRDHKEEWTQTRPPPKIMNDKSSNVSIESIDPKMSATGGEYRWPIYHVQRKRIDRQSLSSCYRPTLVVYFHSGAFYLPCHPVEWAFVQGAVGSDVGLDYVFAEYTLAPYATGGQVIRGAVEVLLNISEDERYREHDIVLMGCSAGGWITVRLAQVLTRLAMGQTEIPGVPRGHSWDLVRVQALRRRLKRVISISGVLSLNITDSESVATAQKDVQLNYSIVAGAFKLWALGPSGFPEFDFEMPRDAPSQHIRLSDQYVDESILLDGCFSLENDCHAFEEYAKYVEGSKDGKTLAAPLKIYISIGTADTLHPGNRRVAQALHKLDKEAVTLEYHEVPGQIHGFSLLPIPEAKENRRRLKQILQACIDGVEQPCTNKTRVY